MLQDPSKIFCQGLKKFSHPENLLKLKLKKKRPFLHQLGIQTFSARQMLNNWPTEVHSGVHTISKSCGQDSDHFDSKRPHPVTIASSSSSSSCTGDLETVHGFSRQSCLFSTVNPKDWGNKALDKWTQTISLPKAKAQFFQTHAQVVCRILDKIVEDSVEHEAMRRELYTMLQGWGAKTEKLSKVSNVHLGALLVYCKALMVT